MADLARAEREDDKDHALLSAKMSVPHIRAPVIVRPRLLALVSKGLEGPLTVVSAAPGAGKTLLMASWIAHEQAPGPVAWLSLDPYDDSPGVFWTYVVGTLRRHDVELPADIGQPMRGDEVDRSFLARLANALAARPQPVVLVLDELEHVTRRDVLQGLAFVLRASAPMLRLVVLTRSATHLGLHRYELTGEVVQIDRAALAFTSDEVQTLLRQHGVRLSPEALASLTDVTEGWAAGLRLSAVAMQRQDNPDDFVKALPAHSTLTGYLLEEVLSTQSEETRDFLLRTSIVDRLCPDLADALTGRTDGRLVLRALQAANVLTEALEDAPDWYRYHPLFGQVLQSELRSQQPDLVAQLHRTASAWFERTGFLVEAVGHASAAEDWQMACATLVRRLAVGKLLTGRDVEHFKQLFAAMPADEPGAMPAVVRSAVAMAAFDLGSCRVQLDAARQRVAGEAPVDREPVLACAAVVRTVMSRAVSDVDATTAAAEEAEKLLAGLPEQAAQYPELRALVLSSLATVQIWAGRFEEAERTLEEGRVASAQPGCEYPRLNILGQTAWIEHRKGHLRRATALAEEALRQADSSGLPVRHRTGANHLALALVALEWNDRAAFRKHLKYAEKSTGARYDGVIATAVPLLRALQHARARDFRRACAALGQVPTAVGGSPLPPWLATRVAMTRAVVDLGRSDTAAATAALDDAPYKGPEWKVTRAAVAAADGDTEQALELLSAALSAGTAETSFATFVEGWVLMARVRLAEGEESAADKALRHALGIARPESHRRAFVDAGPWLSRFLRAHPDILRSHDWLGPPFTEGTSSPRADEVSGLAVEPERLTERERAVLVRMAQAMSNQDIATDLFVSVNTVKSHQKSIYRKLAVVRRNDAVRRARELELI